MGESTSQFRLEIRSATAVAGLPAWRQAMTRPYAVYNVTPPTSSDDSDTLGAKYASHPTYPTYAPFTAPGFVQAAIRAWGAGVLAEDLGSHGGILTGMNGHEAPHGTIIHHFDIGTAKWQFPVRGPDFFKAVPGNFVPPAGAEAFYDPQNLNGYPAFTDNPPVGYVGNWHVDTTTSDPSHGGGWSYVDWDSTDRMSPLHRSEYLPNVGMGMRYDTLAVVPQDAGGEPAGTLVIMPNPFSHTFGAVPTANAHRVGLTTKSWLARSVNSERDLGGALFSSGRNTAYSKKYRKVYMVGNDREGVEVYSPLANALSRKGFEDPAAGAVIVGGNAVITNGLAVPNLLIVLGVLRSDPNRYVLIVGDLDEIEAQSGSLMYAIAPTGTPGTLGARALKLLSGPFAIKSWPGGVFNPTIHLAWAEKRKKLIVFQANRDPATDTWVMPASPFVATPVIPWPETLHVIDIPDGSVGGVPNWRTQNWISTQRQLALGPNTAGLVVDPAQSHNLYKRVSWSEKADCLLLLTGGTSPVQAITLA